MSHAVDQLKELLFNKEHEELTALQQRVDELQELADRRKIRLDEVFERTGSRDRMRSSVAEVLEGALQDADLDETRSAHLRKAMVPFVASTVTTEITNNRDVLVQVLSPSIGVMIRDYITSAMNDMMAQINRKLENAIPGRASKMRAKAKAAGMTMAEMALAETQQLTVVELYLVRRGSGQVIDHWSSDELLTPAAIDTNRAPDTADSPAGSGASVAIGSNRDALVGGFLTAITDFAKEAFEAEKSSLRSLQMDGFHVYLRSSAAYLLAAKCRGARLPGIERAIDAEFLRIMSEHNDVLSQATAPGRASNGATNSGPTGSGTGSDRESTTAAADLKQVLPALAKSLEARVAARHDELFATEPTGASPIKMLAWVIGLPLIVLIGWLAWQSYWTTWTLNKTHNAIASIADMKGYPITIDVEPGGGAVKLWGLTPSSPVKGQVVRALSKAMPKVAIQEELTVLPIKPPIDPEPKIAEVRRGITELKISSDEKLVELEARNQRRLADLATENKRRISSSNEKLDKLEARSQQQLSDLAKENKQRIFMLESQFASAATKRALDRAGKSLGTVLSSLPQLLQQLNGDNRAGSDRAATANEIRAILEQTRAAREELTALRKNYGEVGISPSALSPGALSPAALATDLNQLTGKIAGINRALSSLSAMPLVEPGEAALPRQPAQSAEELSLAALRLSLISASAARVLSLSPVTKSVGEMTLTMNEMRRRIEELTPGPRQKLAIWTRENAIFFAQGSEFRNALLAAKKLDELAKLLRDARALIRVVGFTDDTGGQARNAPLALARANTVAAALRARSIKAGRIAIVGRNSGPDLNASSGAGSPNRRVEFAVGFFDEQAGGR